MLVKEISNCAICRLEGKCEKLNNWLVKNGLMDLMVEHVNLCLSLFPEFNRPSDALAHTLAKAEEKFVEITPAALKNYLTELIIAEKAMNEFSEVPMRRPPLPVTLPERKNCQRVEPELAGHAVGLQVLAADEELSKIISFWDNLPIEAAEYDGGETLFKLTHGYTKINSETGTDIFISPECNFVFVIIDAGNYWFYEVEATGIL